MDGRERDGGCLFRRGSGSGEEGEFDGSEGGVGGGVEGLIALQARRPADSPAPPHRLPRDNQVWAWAPPVFQRMNAV